VHEGEVIGKVGNFFRRPGGTTYHLHFDVQVPTRHGWVFVNPYMTLVAAYERLIQGRGEVVTDAMYAPPVRSAAANPADAAKPQSSAPADSPGPIAHVPLPRPAPAAAALKQAAKVAADADGKRFGQTARKDKREPTKVSARNCKAGVAKSTGGRHCGVGRNKSGAHAKHARSVRSVGRHVSHKGNRARHHGRNLHKGHARAKARHGRV
jgi:hypothetical protein